MFYFKVECYMPDSQLHLSLTISNIFCQFPYTYCLDKDLEGAVVYLVFFCVNGGSVEITVMQFL